jgi:hypothetical protein
MMFVVLSVYTYQQQPAALVALGADRGGIVRGRMGIPPPGGRRISLAP